MVTNNYLLCYLQDIIQQIEMATPEEREGVSLLCIWNGDGPMAKFFCYNLSLFHSSSRVCECAPLKKSNFYLEREVTNSCEMSVLCTPMIRNKILSHPAPIRTYPHRTNILFDFHFSLSYSILLNVSVDGSSEYLFQDFQEKVDVNKQIDSQIAKHFNNYCKKLEKLANDYQGEIIMGQSHVNNNEEMICIPVNLKGHTQKKSAVNTLADDLEIKVFTFRAGW